MGSFNSTPVERLEPQALRVFEPRAPPGLSASEVQLFHALLSPAARSDVRRRSVVLKAADIPMKSDGEIKRLMEASVPGVGTMLDRLGEHPVCHYMCLTYRRGLPAQAGTPKLQEYTKLALRFLVSAVSKGGAHEDRRRRVCTALAEAFQACQQVQARVIDQLYGCLTGRDEGLKGQLLVLVDTLKQRALDEVTLRLHPDCLSPAVDMGRQMPHIESAYISACGEQLGLRGVETSRIDRMKPHLSQRQLGVFLEEYSHTFSVREVVHAFVRDVNQVGEAADRAVSLDTLFAWCRQAAEDSDFDGYDVFFQAERAHVYSAVGGPPPAGCAADALQAPWLHEAVAEEILRRCLGAKAPARGG
mmetsp:Transcript_58367/g.173700  ORF Transcript_58367/g.173700 Transcript_58367/m.173700 type:complete len:360 (-) Transcript_58367:274-1353(-)